MVFNSKNNFLASSFFIVKKLPTRARRADAILFTIFIKFETIQLYAEYIGTIVRPNTFDIITVFANKDCRIKIYQLENNSGSAQRPRLTAEKLAQGAFICQLDADDVLEKRYLEKLDEIANNESIENHPHYRR